jgi:hypothetical protein
VPFQPKPLELSVEGWMARTPLAPEAPPPGSVSAAAPAEEIASATLAEVYFNQGFTDKAIDVYKRLLGREPGNSKAAARLTELEMLERHLRGETMRAAVPAASPASPVAPSGAGSTRRQTLERTISRLESFMAAASALRQGSNR